MNNTNELLKKIQEHNSSFIKYRQIRTLTQFLDGELLTLECEDSAGNKEIIYCYSSHGQYKSFGSVDAVLMYQDQSLRSRQRPKINLNLNPNMVAGFIAIMITTIICYISWVSTDRNIAIDIPQILSNALATIIGFYFGSQVTSVKRGD